LLDRLPARLAFHSHTASGNSIVHTVRASALHLLLTLLPCLNFLLQAHDIAPLLLTALLELLDPPLCPLDLLLDELQASVHGGHSVGLVLLQEDGSDELVDVGRVGEGGELGGDGAVLGELRFESLARGDGRLEVCQKVSEVDVRHLGGLSAGQGKRHITVLKLLVIV
jgi:hypothetical protein